MFRPFADVMLNISNGFSELCITSLFVIIPILEFDISVWTFNTIDNTLVLIVYTIMAVNMIFSLIMGVTGIVKIIRSRNNKVNSANPTPTEAYVNNKADFMNFDDHNLEFFKYKIK